MLIWHKQEIKDTASTLIHAMAEALKLKCGISAGFTEIPMIYQYLATTSWIKIIWIH